jgi:DNA-binding transcriptional ArsR family regulator
MLRRSAVPKSTPLVRRIDPALLKRAADIIKLLGHPERLKIVEVLEHGDRTVTEICEACHLEQAIGSQHLGKLRRLGVVVARREPPHVYYRITEPKVHHILRCIRQCDG